eukprot:RCo031145
MAVPACIAKAGAMRVAITVLAKPNAKVSAITGVTEEALGVAIAAPPKEGLANAALVQFLAQELGLKRRQVSLDKGSASKHKRVLVDETTVEDVWQKIQESLAS